MRFYGVTCINPCYQKRDKNDMMYGVLHTEVHVVVMYGGADEQVLSTATPHTATTIVAIHTSYKKYGFAKKISPFGSKK